MDAAYSVASSGMAAVTATSLGQFGTSLHFYAVGTSRIRLGTARKRKLVGLQVCNKPIRHAKAALAKHHQAPINKLRDI